MRPRYPPPSGPRRGNLYYSGRLVSREDQRFGEEQIHEDLRRQEYWEEGNETATGAAGEDEGSSQAGT